MRWGVALLVLALGVLAAFLLTRPGEDDSPLATGPGNTDGRSAAVVDRSWEEAWTSGDAEVLRSWFEANTGPTGPVEGEVPGGDIRSQEDADRLTGRTVTSGLDVQCDCVLANFVLVDGELWVQGGDVTIRDALLDAGTAPDMIGPFTARGDAEVHLSNVEITGHHDGIRAYAERVTGEYVYIHGMAEENPEDHHQDGIQTIGGTSAFQRVFIDMRGANTSATLIKPDAGPIPFAQITYSVLMGGVYTFHVHDGPKGTPEEVDLSNNLVAPGYGKRLVSTWELTDPEEVLGSTYATVSETGQRVGLVDGVRIPSRRSSAGN